MKLGKFIAGGVAALTLSAFAGQAGAAILYQSIADLTEPANSNGFCSQCNADGQSIGQAFSLATAATATQLTFTVSSGYAWPVPVTVGIYRDGGATVGASVYNNVFTSFASDHPTVNGTDVVTVNLGAVSLSAGSYLLFLTNPSDLAIPGYINSGAGAQIVVPLLTSSAPLLTGDHYNYVAAGTYDAGVLLSGTSGAPEPAGWALLLVGFGGMGAVIRRRRGTEVA